MGGFARPLPAKAQAEKASRREENCAIGSEVKSDRVLGDAKQVSNIFKVPGN